jgi:hypothetical protein
LAAAVLASVAPDAADDAPHGGAPPALPNSAAPADVAYPAIAQLPLFSTTRRPWQPPPRPVAPQGPAATQPPPAARQPPQNYTLVGTVVSDGVRVALLRTGTRTLSLPEGGQLDGWTLRDVRSDGLRFEADGATFDLAFPLLKSAAPPPRPF